MRVCIKLPLQNEKKSLASKVHLGVSPADDAVEIFWGKTTCLFVWLDNKNGNDMAMVGDTLPDRFPAAIAFVGMPTDDENAEEGTAGAAAKQHSRLQCVTLQPSSSSLGGGLGGDDGGGGEESKELQGANDDDDAANAQATLLQALQLYTRHLFLPAVKKQKDASSSVLQDKIRELDVAIGQSQRSARLPHVVLQVDPLLEQVVSTALTALEIFSKSRAA